MQCIMYCNEVKCIIILHQLLLQVMIVLSGNYNFFNLLTMTLCLSLMDDVHLGYQHGQFLRFCQLDMELSQGGIFHHHLFS